MKRSVAVSLALFALACQGEPSHAGVQEPLRVPNGFFHEGALPGIAPSEQPEEAEELSPRVLNVVLGGIGVVRPGQAGIGLRGTTTEGAFSIAVKIADAGSGHWVRPVGAETAQPNEREWDARLDFSADIEPGPHQLEIVAIDGEGNAGPQTTFRFCVSRDVESTRNACDPSVLPPAAIISLSWESNADVDLVVVTPSGIAVDATNPTTLELNGGEDVDAQAPGVGVLSIDSNASCRRDGVQRETLTWNVSPEPGAYEVYAKLFEPCGAASTPLKVEAFARTRGEDDGTYGLGRVADDVHGLLLSSSPSGDEDRGLFITTIEFP